MEKPAFVETLQKTLYGKSSNPFAAENADDADFQRGYADGDRTANEPADGRLRPAIWYEVWEKFGTTHNPRWQSWSRGFQAAQMAKITLK